MRPKWMGLGPNSLSKGSLFGIFSLLRSHRRLAKMGRFPPKFTIKVGMTASFGN